MKKSTVQIVTVRVVFATLNLVERRRLLYVEELTRRVGTVVAVHTRRVDVHALFPIRTVREVCTVHRRVVVVT